VFQDQAVSFDLFREGLLSLILRAMALLFIADTNNRRRRRAPLLL